MKLLAVFPAIFLFGQMTGALAAGDTAAITLAGRVLANTCTIDSGSATQVITLPTISDRDTKVTGAVDHVLTEVPIILRNCGAAATSVVVNTSGKANGENYNMFDNTIDAGSEGRATGIGIYFYQTNGSNLLFPDGRRAETIQLTPSVDNTLTFYATYGITTASVTPGNISAVVNMTFDYQ
ncbi:type 1 fimbrial protein [Salmonella enterica]|uniref:Type 1 fimbrial protein n=2 Tax=Salmonella enterica TaxID=28901 RepID=A0A6Y0WFK0_SALEB|nr:MULTISPECIES: fimbrial protein [Enterobacteriaceae]ECG6654079.1 type 1 fimbrial protein [Salmonella enterica subsp. enterica serovar Java]ECL3879780.1 type 1 fimbrial protein [Salmonella enterica subsp. enterica]EKY1903423.1 type 1 fimbrial protein [Cronobacter sakazakii]HCC0035602.1 type 1 fimbrial protein [Salmonella enterica subsp. enterica serovar Paratyphi B]HCQ0109806.1 type 1 fimbrial protein [Citrobacter braakii]